MLTLNEENFLQRWLDARAGSCVWRGLMEEDRNNIRDLFLAIKNREWDTTIDLEFLRLHRKGASMC